MMRRVKWLAAVLAWSLAVSGGAGQVPLRFAHAPALSPDATSLAFQWDNDVWLAAGEGGLAIRLTVGDAYDGDPEFSPDGRLLAFESQRDGNVEVYVMSVGGGDPRRVTYHSAADRLDGFSPDGQHLLFFSNRDAFSVGPMGYQYQVPVAGGTPLRVHRAEGTRGAWSPDGRYLAFVRGWSSRYRRGYEGSAAEDLWVLDTADGSYRAVAPSAAVDTRPMWSPDGQTIYFVSTRANGIRNLFAVPAAGGEVQQLTDGQDHIYEPSIARNAGVICYEAGESLWRLEPGGVPRRLELVGAAEPREAAELWETRTGDATTYAVAPSGKEVAFVVRGDVYVTRFPAGGMTRQVTDTVASEGGLSWSKDSSTLYFHSDREGQYDLYAVTSGQEDEPRLRYAEPLKLTRLTSTPEDEFAPQVSPDGKRLTYLRDRGDIVVSDLAVERPLVVVPGWNWADVAWSPDSRWLAYARRDANANEDVFIVSADGGEPVNVSQHPLRDRNPSWSGDGTKLAFLSDRNNDQTDVYFVWLSREAAQETAADRELAEDRAYDQPKAKPKPKEEPNPDADATEGAAAPQGPPKEAPKPDDKSITIDFAGLHERLVRVTRSVFSESHLAFSPDGKSLAYAYTDEAGNRDLYVTGWSEYRPQALTTGNTGPWAVSWLPDSKAVCYLRRGGRVSRTSSDGRTTQTVAFEAEIRRGLAQERAYLFDLVWRIMRDEFYDPEMHGVDWAGLKDRYAAMAAATQSRSDFDRVIELMLGELNSSHMGFGLPHRAPAAPQAAELGIVWAAPPAGQPGLLAAEVLADGPADKVSGRVGVGERIFAVDGQPVGPEANAARLLLGKAGRQVRLQVADAEGTEREVVVRPSTAGQVAEARYTQWVLSQQAKTAELSDGRVGYLHLRRMDGDSVAAFTRDLFAAGNGREALVIDVRWNGGGWTADLILSMLDVRPHAYTVSRGGPRGYPVDRLSAPAWTGPSVLLINGRSISNAEILAHAFKTLQRGPLVGEPTNGGVISTGGATLFDGSSLRLPGRGWYRTGDDVNLEGNPAEPDQYVPLEPAAEAAGDDPQLAAAVKAALDLVGPVELP